MTKISIIHTVHHTQMGQMPIRGHSSITERPPPKFGGIATAYMKCLTGQADSRSVHTK